ncbi:hypothetical protein [Legionella sp. km772]|uniref:hypothetical protein n=1 Tax=Legionella sp. km772 TaxID=2498111 RepID=UPI000F8CAB2E|nr:hypothetical protein [Legionella sp. km772]RUR07217.1 hypothetical protein ELY15_12435 [Legionella sp. km772]
MKSPCLSLPQENTEASLKSRYETLRQRVAAINLETVELKKREQEITHLITKIPGDLHDLNKVLTTTTQKIKTAETQIKSILKDIDSLYVEMKEAIDPFELATVQYAQPKPKLLSATEQLAEPLIRERYLDTQLEARPLQGQEKRIVVPENPLQGSYTPPDATI